MPGDPDRAAEALTLDVALGERSYPIFIGDDLLTRPPDRLFELVRGRQVAIVSNPTVAGHYMAGLQRALAGQAHSVLPVLVPDGEAHKNWASLSTIFDALLAARFDRNSLIVALGGGVIGDLAGLAAALYQRGIDFVQVPTTLLAQVDSSVGGKTAINHPAGKNMIGAFHQPRLVLADTGTLRTLPQRELGAGLAEMLKHGAIADPSYLAGLVDDMAALRRCDAQRMTAAVLRSCQIKAEVVASDERESGRRAILNFGHTFGHAIEAGAGYGQWLHGEAVAAGMVAAADLSHRALGLPAADAGLVRDAIRVAELPTRAPAWPAERYLALMGVDKKATQGIPRFVLLPALGDATLCRVEEEPLLETLREWAVAT
ncbi:MAG: 3-dehydroquinate synthase [Burkholderiaceae bacterium]